MRGDSNDNVSSGILLQKLESKTRGNVACVEDVDVDVDVDDFDVDVDMGMDVDVGVGSREVFVVAKEASCSFKSMSMYSGVISRWATW